MTHYISIKNKFIGKFFCWISLFFVELNRLFNTNRVTYERMLQLEEHVNKFDEFKLSFEKYSMSESGGVGGPGTSNATKSVLMSELQSKLGELYQLKDKEQLSMRQENENGRWFFKSKTIVFYFTLKTPFLVPVINLQRTWLMFFC